MNTTITTNHVNVASVVLTFCAHHKVDVDLRHTAENLVILHCKMLNPFLVTKLQDELINGFPLHAFSMLHAA